MGGKDSKLHLYLLLDDNDFDKVLYYTYPEMVGHDVKVMDDCWQFSKQKILSRNIQLLSSLYCPKLNLLNSL